MYFAQITDFHLKRTGESAYGVDPTAKVRRGVDALNALSPAPDFVFVTGDIVDSGSFAEYENAVSILSRLSVPYYVIPGNHDSRDGFLEAFRGVSCPADCSGFAQFHFSHEGYEIIALDTVKKGSAGGELCATRLAWLREVLAKTEGSRRVLFMHHPPIRTGIDHMDAIGLESSVRFSELLAEYPAETHIYCGHIHRAVSASWSSASVHICPGLVHQINIDLHPQAPGRYIFEPPAYRVVIEKDGSLVNHILFVEDFGPSHGFA